MAPLIAKKMQIINSNQNSNHFLITIVLCNENFKAKEPAIRRSHCDTLSLTFPANEDIENFQMSFSLIFQFKESQFLLRIVAEYIGDVIFV